MSLKQPGVDRIKNIGCIAAATLVYVFTVAWFHSFETALWGPQISGEFLVWVLPLLVECLAAALLGGALAYFLRTERPIAYGLLFAGALVLWWLATTTIGRPGWRGFFWIALDALLPALVAAFVTSRLSRRREAKALLAAKPV
jgi:hypothetical protein